MLGNVRKEWNNEIVMSESTTLTETTTPEATADWHEYLESDCDTCPFCQSENLSWDNLEQDGDDPHQMVTCIDCDESWTDTYHRDGVFSDGCEWIERVKPSTTSLWLIIVEGDVEPIKHGPFDTDEERLAAARAHRHTDDDLHDGIYRLDIVDGIPMVDSFSGGELDND